jgi:N-dimethylarginine dimethylaminohydrolase
VALLHEFFDADNVEDSYDAAIEEEVWGGGFGASDYVSPVDSILVHSPGHEVELLAHARYDEAAGTLVLKDGKGRARSYFQGRELPDFELMRSQHAALVQLLSDNGIAVHDYTVDPQIWGNRLFTRDPALITPHGAILCRMSGFFRQGETIIIEKTLADLQIPIIGAIQGRGFIEGGSFSIINPHTAVIGRSVRNNDEGIEQLRWLLALQGLELLVVDVPADKIHLDEMFLMLSYDKALVDTRIIPHWFLRKLRDMGIEAIEVDPEDPPLTNNCIAIAPGKIIFPASGVRTMDALERRGLQILPVDVSELNKMGGSIHCLTLPLHRKARVA